MILKKVLEQVHVKMPSLVHHMCMFLCMYGGVFMHVGVHRLYEYEEPPWVGLGICTKRFSLIAFTFRQFSKRTTFSQLQCEHGTCVGGGGGG